MQVFPSARFSLTCSYGAARVHLFASLVLQGFAQHGVVHFFGKNVHLYTWRKNSE